MFAIISSPSSSPKLPRAESFTQWANTHPPYSRGSQISVCLQVSEELVKMLLPGPESLTQ